jgi:hypothetical protein
MVRGFTDHFKLEIALNQTKQQLKLICKRLFRYNQSYNAMCFICTFQKKKLNLNI